MSQHKEAGWYLDEPGRERWWDGTRWTAQSRHAEPPTVSPRNDLIDTTVFHPIPAIHPKSPAESPADVPDRDQFHTPTIRRPALARGGLAAGAALTMATAAGLTLTAVCIAVLATGIGRSQQGGTGDVDTVTTKTAVAGPNARDTTVERHHNQVPDATSKRDSKTRITGSTLEVLGSSAPEGPATSTPKTWTKSQTTLGSVAEAQDTLGSRALTDPTFTGSTIGLSLQDPSAGR